MKLGKWFSLGLVVSASTLVFACGGKDDNKGQDGNGEGGAGNKDPNAVATQADLSGVEKEIDTLNATIKDLKEQLANASQQDIPDLQTDLDAANDRLDALENCANGGSCDGVTTAMALSSLTDAYCDWVFGCCTDDEARATLGSAAKDAKGCKGMFSQLILRGGSFPSMPGFPGAYSSSEALGEIAARLQGGRISLDEKALKACAGELGDMACLDADPVKPEECSVGGSSMCSDFILGLQDAGEPCAYSDDCKDGLLCSISSGGTKDGVCLKEAVEDDFCQAEDDCMNSAGDLYCDESKGTCQVRAGEGDDCSFADPTFDKLSPTEQTLPCLPGYWCSLETSTCMAQCDTLKKGDTCSDSDQCGDAMFCDMAALKDQGYAGECKQKLVAGAASTDAEACKSGSLFNDTMDANYDEDNCANNGTDCASRCDSEGGEKCSYDDFSGSDCNSGSCKESSDTCRTKCDAQYDCGKSETCFNSVCYESVTSHSDCLVTEQCPSDEYCNAGSCTDRVKTGDRDDSSDDCTDNEQCTSGSACVDSDCVPYEGLGTDAYCSDWYHCTSGRCELNPDLVVADNNKCIAAASLGDKGDDCDMKGLDAGNINQDPCKSGLFCKRDAPNSTTDFSGVCAPQMQPGQACDHSLATNVRQCVGNEVCSVNDNTGVNSCRLPYSEPDQNDKCVLGSSTFRVQVAYGDSGTYGNIP